MSDSSLHEILNDIRIRYSGKRVSIIDIRMIEDKYRICSITNFRNDNCAFLRITSYGMGEVMFEDVVVNTNLLKPYATEDELLFKAQKILYELAYGISFVSDAKSVIDCNIEEPSFVFSTLRDELNMYKKKCEELENRVTVLSAKADQMTLFDI